jgi:hypothetical protein
VLTTAKVAPSIDAEAFATRTSTPKEQPWNAIDL